MAPQNQPEDDIRAFPNRIVSGSKRHLILSVVVGGLGFASELISGASFGVLALVAAVTIFLIVYNLVRIRNARAARTSDRAARAFVQQQRRSHLSVDDLPSS